MTADDAEAAILEAAGSGLPRVAGEREGRDDDR
jgi:hypothetical protein